MHRIKRYANRKLYDTTDKQYVTLDDIAGLVQGGEEVEVVDNESGDDITNVTLSQIIFEKQKKKDGFLPRALFHELIQSSGGTLYETLQKLFAGGMGMAMSMEKEGERLLKRFVSSGDISEDESHRLLDDLRGRAEKTKEWVDVRVEQVLKRMGVVTQTELREMLTLLEEVRGKLHDLESAAAAPAPDADDDQK